MGLSRHLSNFDDEEISYEILQDLTDDDLHQLNIPQLARFTIIEARFLARPEYYNEVQAHRVRWQILRNRLGDRSLYKSMASVADTVGFSVEEAESLKFVLGVGKECPVRALRTILQYWAPW